MENEREPSQVLLMVRIVRSRSIEESEKEKGKSRQAKSDGGKPEILLEGSA